MLLVLSPTAFDAHDSGPGHPEGAARIPAALAGIADSGADTRTALPRAATDQELGRVHDLAYVHALEAFCSSGGGPLDPDTVVGPHSFEAAREAAGSGLVAIEALAAGAADAAFVVTRPPGHHAVTDRAMGFCLVNNVAVAAAALVEGGERVCIVDWDVHHGNGTQAIFWDDPRVLYASTHQSPFYPETGGVDEAGGPGAPGSTVNVPLPPGTTGDVVVAALDQVVAPVVERFAPTWVLVSAGFDAHRQDPLADFELTAGDFADLAARVRAYAPRTGRLVLFLEGGYHLAALRQSVAASAAAVAGVPFDAEPTSRGGPGMAAVAAARGVPHPL